jgi:uncharacterized membrane protein
MGKKFKILIWSIVVLSFIGLIISYQFLPERIPIHWDSNWEVDNFANKNMIFLLGLLPAGLLVFFDLQPQIDPRVSNVKKNSKEYGIIRYAIVILLVIASWLSVLTALEINIDFKLIFPILLGITFMVMGNYLPRVKSNFYLGIKNPWVLSDETVWRKTHKAGGYLFFITGLFIMAMGIIHTKYFARGVIGFLFLGIVIVNIYSYILFKRIGKESE